MSITDETPRLRAPQIDGETFNHFGNMLRDAARRHPDKTAVIDGDRRWSWAEFHALVARIAGALQARGVGPDSMVMSLAENSAEHLALYAGVLTAGGCMVPLPFSATEAALTKMVADCGAELLFASPRQIDRARTLSAPQVLPLEDIAAWCAEAAPATPAEVTPDNLFDMIYSSGTTGTPKGIVHDHRFRSRQFSRFPAFGLNGDSIQLMSTPLYSNTTLVAVLTGLVTGGTIVSLGKFDTRAFLDLSVRHGVTHAMLVPVQYMRLLDDPTFDTHDLSAYRCKFSTSAPLPAPLIERIMAHWPGNLVNFYGMTEGGVSTILDCAAHPDKWDTAGRPPAGAEVRIIDDAGAELPVGAYGEIIGRSGAMMPGYHNAPEKTAEIRWRDAEGRDFIRTGDMGRLDEDGFLTLLDRKKDMIISGGFNIYAADLEAVLRQHPQVTDVAVIAVPSRDWGETPLGLVVTRPGSTAAAEDIRTWANEQLGKTQRLSRVEFRDTLPRSEIGKILKRELRAPYWEEAPA
ncbi:class I adenylate-forming enzyme family protein [Pseudooceanicola aestuarii]|uniref:class I adenylate-forming enzyme family protein n=1 Tax=Pseudooceanicola aestuarii TaxID=2697319 RepID=UPI001EF90F31|nr:AMP-binding protein [Pseudooceanicola aestuarii]